MTTDISVQSTQYQVENRSWLLGKHGTEDTPSVTLDISKFVQADDYPNGYIPSGYPIGQVTATGLYGPYDGAASDGRETCKYLLFSLVRVVRQDGSKASKVGGAGLVHGFVDETKLPGALDSAGQADLAHIIFNGVIADESSS